MNVTKKKFDTTQAFEKSIANRPKSAEPYVLRLYVTGMTARSMAAFSSIKGICEKYLRGRYDLEVIDIYQQPSLARDEQIIAAPTLVKRLPSPPKRLVGNLSEIDRVLAGLGLSSRA